jgi:N-acetyl-gamma-glutamyl-phosphate reductase
MKLVRVAVVGASGYTGQELIRILLDHPHVTLSAVTSRQQAGERLEDVYGLPKGVTDLVFVNPTLAELPGLADVFFLALPHGLASEFAEPLRRAGKIVLDLSADFRLKDPALYEEFYHAAHPAPDLLTESVYGLPELHGAAVKSADLIACPGCYPTSILLALAPALTHGWVDPRQIVINSMSGVSGAGRKADLSLLFSECDSNVKAYSFPIHRHHPEIEQEISNLAGQPIVVSFTPHLVPLVRGMLSTISAPLAGAPESDEDLAKQAGAFYEASPFVKVLSPGNVPEVKNVAGTNRCDLAYRNDRRAGRLVIVSVIDNLGKGAAGQAVQAFNLRLGFSETSGLLAKNH